GLAARDDLRRRHGDPGRLRQLPIDVRVEHRNRDAIVERGDFLDERHGLGIGLAAELRREHRQLDGPADPLELPLDRLLILRRKEPHGSNYTSTTPLPTAEAATNPLPSGEGRVRAGLPCHPRTISSIRRYPDASIRASIKLGPPQLSAATSAR